MLLTTWLVVGALGTLATLVAVVTTDDGVAVVGGVIGFIAWGLWTFGALNVEVVGGAVVYQYSMPPVALLGLAIALVPGYIALTGPVEMVGRVRDGRLEDV